MKNIYEDILIIKSNKDSFENFYNIEMTKCGVTVWDVADVESKHSNYLYRQIRVGKKVIKKWKRTIKSYKSIIVFDSYFLIPWLYMIKRKDSSLILWKWNPANDFLAKRISNICKLCDVWTFNHKDAEKYGWKVNTQFYFRPCIVKSNDEAMVAFFVGKDKARYRQLIELSEKLEKYAIKCNFKIIPEKGGIYKDGSILLEEQMEYREVIDNITKTQFIVDYVQNNQDGLTVRALEALFYNKKIITNNLNIINEPLYNSQNIYIVGKDKWEQLEEFIQNRVFINDEKVKSFYTFEAWLDRFKK